jgi:hypothetical protein
MSLMPLFMGVKQAAVISTAFTVLATLITFVRHYGEYRWRLGAGFLVRYAPDCRSVFTCSNRAARNCWCV